MAAEKLSVSLDPHIAARLRRRARELGKPASRYISDLVEADLRRARDELAIAGYGDPALSRETTAFAEAALPVGNETWPAWEE